MHKKILISQKILRIWPSNTKLKLTLQKLILKPSQRWSLFVTVCQKWTSAISSRIWLTKRIPLSTKPFSLTRLWSMLSCTQLVSNSAWTPRVKLINSTTLLCILLLSEELLRQLCTCSRTTQTKTRSNLLYCRWLPRPWTAQAISGQMSTSCSSSSRIGRYSLIFQSSTIWTFHSFGRLEL